VRFLVFGAFVVGLAAFVCWFAHVPPGEDDGGWWDRWDDPIDEPPDPTPEFEEELEFV
jgi:hypothetical protein